MQYVIINDEVWSTDTEAECDAAAAELARVGLGDTPVWSGTGEGPDDVKTGRVLVPRAATEPSSRCLYAIEFRAQSDGEMTDPSEYWTQRHDFIGVIDGGRYNGWVVAPLTEAELDALCEDDDVETWTGITLADDADEHVGEEVAILCSMETLTGYAD